MRNLLKIASIIGLTVITQTAYSAEVTDTFTTGDTLTAEKLNNIKSAVNDNNTRISAVVFNSAPKVTDDMNSHTVGTVWIDTSGPTAYILVDSTAGGAVWTALGGSATGSLYAIGDTGPAGGIVFHVTDGGLHGLEAAAEDLTKSRWGCERTIIAGANGTAVGTGEQNTADITEFCDEITAAKVAAASGLGWYLPTKDELNLLYAQKDVVGGFSHAAFYWSSSQFSASDAWGQNFGFAVFFRPLNKFGTVSVRAVRAF
jgi:hypothetical protein